jgi:hypothetical protein
MVVAAKGNLRLFLRPHLLPSIDPIALRASSTVDRGIRERV